MSILSENLKRKIQIWNWN